VSETALKRMLLGPHLDGLATALRRGKE
jgi:hypothetical protein